MWTRRWRCWPGQGLEAIVVGIPNIGERHFHEYIPFPSPEVDGVQGDEYVAFIAGTVKPIMDRDFRTPARGGGRRASPARR